MSHSVRDVVLVDLQRLLKSTLVVFQVSFILPLHSLMLCAKYCFFSLILRPSIANCFVAARHGWRFVLYSSFFQPIS